MNLLHLVSAQTLQNLLPIMALRPENIIQVRSDHPPFEKAALHLCAAVGCLARSPHFAGYAPEFFEMVIPSPTPSVDQARRKVGEALSLWPGCLVNLTGGTKQMSIGAYLAAQYQLEPAMYCDTQAGAFVPAFDPRWGFPVLPDLHEVAALVDVGTVLAAHGIDPASLHARQPGDSQLAFARRILTIFSSSRAEYAGACLAIRNALRPHNRLPKKSEIAGILAAGLPEATSPAHEEIYRASFDAGWLTAHGGRPKPAIPPGAKSAHAINLAMNFLQAVEGDWFELVVFEEMRTSGRFSDLRMGVESADAAAALGETDIVGFDTRLLAPVFVSCKVSDEFLKPLEHVFAVRQRATAFGGTFAHVVIRLMECTNEGKRRTLEDACRLLGARLVVGPPSTLSAP